MSGAFPFEPWSTWILFIGMVIIYGPVVLMGATQLYEYWDTMRFMDRIGLVLAIVGFTILVWNFLFGRVFSASGINVPRPAMSVVLTTAGCLLLYGKMKSKKG